VKHASSVLLAFAVVGSFGCALRASDTRLDRETLRGLTALYVVVSNPAGAALDGSRIQAKVVERLRSAGIRVVDADPSTILLPSLFVNISILTRKDESWIYEVSLSLNQAVTIAATHASYMAPTWSVTTLATAGGPGAAGFVRTDVNELTEKFIRAYLAVNRP
jgi:hypothetical protein